MATSNVHGPNQSGGPQGPHPSGPMGASAQTPHGQGQVVKSPISIIQEAVKNMAEEMSFLGATKKDQERKKLDKRKAVPQARYEKVKRKLEESSQAFNQKYPDLLEVTRLVKQLLGFKDQSDDEFKGRYPTQKDIEDALIEKFSGEDGTFNRADLELAITNIYTGHFEQLANELNKSPNPDTILHALEGDTFLPDISHKYTSLRTLQSYIEAKWGQDSDPYKAISLAIDQFQSDPEVKRKAVAGENISQAIATKTQEIKDKTGSTGDELSISANREFYRDYVKEPFSIVFLFEGLLNKGGYNKFLEEKPSPPPTS